MMHEVSLSFFVVSFFINRNFYLHYIPSSHEDGVDSKDNDGDGEYEHYHPLANGEIPLSIAKTFDSYLYAIVSKEAFLLLLLSYS